MNKTRYCLHSRQTLAVWRRKNVIQVFAGFVPEKLLQLEKNEHPEPVIVAEESAEHLKKKQLKKDDSVILDFGNHHVGYVTLDLASTGSHQDAPAYIYLKFAERLDELTTDIATYNGWISKGWIQEEYIHVDVLPTKLKLPRRYAFRYLEIKVLDVSLQIFAGSQ